MGIPTSRQTAGLAARGKSRAGAKNGDCHQFAARHDPRNKALGLKRIGWLYPIFRDLHFYHGLLATFRRKKEKLRGGWVQSANFASECAHKLLIL